MRMAWQDLLFMHYRVDKDAIQAMLPPKVRVDSFDGSAWVGVVPFRMAHSAPRFLPELPFVSYFGELNVRTYVTVDGKPGVWFFTLDATSKIAVRVARTMFHLNYVDAKIQIEKSRTACPGKWIRYRSVRTDRGAPAAELDCEYRPVGDCFFASPETLPHFLTARYCLYTSDRRGNVFRGEINHPVWELRDAQAIIHRNTMLDALGITSQSESPLLHFARETRAVAWLLEKL